MTSFTHIQARQPPLPPPGNDDASGYGAPDGVWYAHDGPRVRPPGATGGTRVPSANGERPPAGAAWGQAPSPRRPPALLLLLLVVLLLVLVLGRQRPRWGGGRGRGGGGRRPPAPGPKRRLRQRRRGLQFVRCPLIPIHGPAPTLPAPATGVPATRGRGARRQGYGQPTKSTGARALSSRERALHAALVGDSSGKACCARLDATLTHLDGLNVNLASPHPGAPLSSLYPAPIHPYSPYVDPCLTQHRPRPPRTRST